jgi:hypothetical protein
VRRGKTAPRGGALSAAIPIGWRLRAIAAAAIIPPLLEIASFARVERLLRSVARMRSSSAPDDKDSAWWVDRALSRLPAPWKRTCLRRAAVLYYLLRSSGRSVDLCIGVRRDEHGELLAHAWLVRDGALYLEPPSTTEVVADYTMIAQFPASFRAP